MFVFSYFADISTRGFIMVLSQVFGAIFSVIGAVSIISNALFYLLLFRKPSLLKKAHNILLLTLTVNQGVFICDFKE